MHRLFHVDRLYFAYITTRSAPPRILIPSPIHWRSMGRFQMHQQLVNLAYVLAFVVVKARTAVASAWWTAIGDQADRYRPEAHYMRGPGPKWRAKHAQSSPDGGKTADFSSNPEFDLEYSRNR